jgi:hypothetical protein
MFVRHPRFYQFLDHENQVDAGRLAGPHPVSANNDGLRLTQSFLNRKLESKSNP